MGVHPWVRVGRPAFPAHPAPGAARPIWDRLNPHHAPQGRLFGCAQGRQGGPQGRQGRLQTERRIRSRPASVVPLRCRPASVVPVVGRLDCQRDDSLIGVLVPSQTAYSAKEAHLSGKGMPARSPDHALGPPAAPSRLARRARRPRPAGARARSRARTAPRARRVRPPARRCPASPVRTNPGRRPLARRGRAPAPARRARSWPAPGHRGSSRARGADRSGGALACGC
jgi:hypothetical protein